MLGIGSMISIALRLFTHRGEIEQLVPRVMTKGQEIERLIPQVQTMITDMFRLMGDIRFLVEKIAPELMPMARIAETRTQPDKFDVKWLQQSLNTLMGTHLSVDGIYGQRTQMVVTAFQERHGLVPDGWAGVATEAKIFELLNRR